MIFNPVVQSGVGGGGEGEKCHITLSPYNKTRAWYILDGSPLEYDQDTPSTSPGFGDLSLVDKNSLIYLTPGEPIRGGGMTPSCVVTGDIEILLQNVSANYVIIYVYGDSEIRCTVEPT